MYFRRTFGFAAATVALTTPWVASAQILGVTDSRTQGFFDDSALPGGFSQSGPAGAGADPGMPLNGAQVAGVNGVNWVPFTYPNVVTFATADAANGIAAGTAITGGYVVPNAGSITSTFVAIPQTSFLTETPNTAAGNVTLTVNFSIDYAIGALGVAGGLTSLHYTAFGTLLNAVSLANFTASVQVWNVNPAGNVALCPLQTITTGNLTFANSPANFNVPLVDNFAVGGLAGAGTVRVDGRFSWTVDPASIEIFAQVTPEPPVYLLLGSAAGIFLLRRKR